MAAKRTAVVFITREWANRPGMRLFFDWSKTATESTPQMILAPLARLDQYGIWLKDITTPVVQRKDGKRAVLEMLIPWQAVEVFALATEGEKQLIGFKPEAE